MTALCIFARSSAKLPKAFALANGHDRVLRCVELSSNSLDRFTASQRVDNPLSFTDAQAFACVVAPRLASVLRR